MSRILGNWLKEYMQYTSASESPNKFHFWTGVSVIAGALRRRVWIEQGIFQWTPNMYILLVAPPGVVSKSTTLSIGMNLLREIDGIKFGPDAVTWQALTQALAEAKDMVLMPEGDYMPMSCITIASSEFGTFMNAHDRELVDVLTSLWDGQLGVWEKKTKTQGSDRIENPWINIAACTTPGWIAGNFPEHLIGGGFTSRCIFVFAKEKRRLVAYPSAVLPPEFAGIRRNLIRDLEAISLLCGAYTLSPEALEFGTDWYKSHWKSKPTHLNNEKFGGYLARKQTHIHKLAMVLSAAHKDELVIDREDLSNAVEIVSALEADMPQVFELIGVEGAAKHTATVLSVVRAHGKISKTEMFKHCFTVMSYREFDEACNAVANSGQVTVSQGAGGFVFSVKENQG